MRSGAKMVDLIQSAGGNFEAFMQQARAAGLVISKEDAAAADEFNDKLDALSFRLEEVARRIGSPLIPRLHALADEFDKAISGTTDDADVWGRVVAGAFDTAAQHADNYLKILKEISNLGPLSRLKDGANWAGQYLIAPDAGFANAAPKGQNGTPAALTADQRGLLEQFNRDLAQASRWAQQNIVGSFSADAEKAIRRLQSEVNLLGDDTRAGKVKEIFREWREAAKQLGDAFKGPVLAQLDKLEAKMRAVAEAWDAKNKQLKAEAEALQKANQAAEAYTRTMDGLYEIGRRINTQRDNPKAGAHELDVRVRNLNGEFGSMGKTPKEAAQKYDVLIAEARYADYLEKRDGIQTRINEALKVEVSLLGEVTELFKNPRALEWSKTVEGKLLRLNAITALFKHNAEGPQLTAPVPPGFENFKAPAHMPAIDPHVGDVVRSTWERIGDYVKGNSGELARDVTGIWQSSLHELYANGVQGFLLSLSSGFLNVAEQIANDYITGIIGGALKKLGESMSKGGGGGILGTILGFLGIAAGAAAGGGANLPASHALPFTQLAPFASGGLVTGPGTSTSDSIRAALSDGEYVMNAQAVDRYGPAFMQSVNQGSYNPATQGGGQRGGVHIENVTISPRIELPRGYHGYGPEKMKMEHDLKAAMRDAVRTALHDIQRGG